MNDKYILDGKTPVPVGDITEWGRWFETADRKVGDDTVGDARVSTVVLGLDHNFGVGRPLLFETMIFGGERDQEQERYSTWEEAEARHKEIVEELKSPKKVAPKSLKKK